MTQWLLSWLVSNGLAALALAAVVWLVTRKFQSPPLAHGLWLLVLLKLISPPLVDVPLPSLRAVKEPAVLTNEAQSISVEVDLQSMQSEIEALRLRGRESISAAPVLMEDGLAKSTPDPIEIEPDRSSETDSHEPVISHRPTLSWAGLLCAVWATGVAIWLAVAIVRIARFRKLLARTRRANAGLQQEVQQLAAELGLRRGPQVRIATGIVPPLTWALCGRPVVLLPKRLLDELTAAERQTLLVHELAHLKRRDHLVRWLELLAVGLNWWQPVAWFARARLHRASEECCDAWVVRRFPHLARAYAEALLKTVDFLAAAQPALPIGSTGFGAAHSLKRRFEMILHDRKNDRMTWLMRLSVLSIACVVLPMSVKSLWAETPKPAEVTGVDVADGAKPNDENTDGGAQASQIPRGYRVAAIHAADAVKRGDRVDVIGLLNRDEKGAVESMAKVILQDIGVYSVMPSDGAKAGDPTNTVSLLLTPDQVESVVSAAENGSFRLVQHNPKDERVDQNAKPQTDLDQRLQRLEATVAKLAEMLDSKLADVNQRQRAENQSKPNSGKGSSPRAVEAKSAAETNVETLADLDDVAYSQKLLDWHSSVKRDLKSKMALSETNCNRLIAAIKQVGAVQGAYSAGTVTLDLLLEAQRRERDAKCAYARTIADLSNLTSDNAAVEVDPNLWTVFELQ